MLRSAAVPAPVTTNSSRRSCGLGGRDTAGRDTDAHHVPQCPKLSSLGAKMLCMAEEMVQRVKPARRDVELKDLTILVRADGNPFAVRCFTEAEYGEAERYATEIHGELVDVSWPRLTDSTAAADQSLS